MIIDQTRSCSRFSSGGLLATEDFSFTFKVAKRHPLCFNVSLSTVEKAAINVNKYTISISVAVIFESINCFAFQLISRKDADPDLMPRLTDYGLNVFEFRAQFCHDCPETFWRLAFLCCAMDPDRRPPFTLIYKWLLVLARDALADQHSYQQLMQEMEIFSQCEHFYIKFNHVKLVITY